MLNKISIELNLGEYEILQLSAFDEITMKEAYKIYSQTKGVINPFKFILGCCRNVKEKQVKNKEAKQANASTGSQGPWRPNGINPWQHMTFEDNIKRWEEYELSPEVQAYTNFFGHAMVDNQRREFIDKLNKLSLPQISEQAYSKKIRFEDKLTAEQLAQEIRKIDNIDGSKMFGGRGYQNRMLYNWANKDYIRQPGEIEDFCLMYIDKVRIRVGLESRILPKFKPESNMINEVLVKQPKTQEIKKGLTNSNVDQIQDWLSVVTYGQDKKILAVVERSVNYNPFDELEDLDSPLQL